MGPKTGEPGTAKRSARRLLGGASLFATQRDRLILLGGVGGLPPATGRAEAATAYSGDKR